MSRLPLALLLALTAGSAAAAPRRPPPAPADQSAAQVLAAVPDAAKPPPPPGEGDWRVPDPQNVLVVDTSKGRILVELTPATAPLAVARVLELTRQGVYDGRAFFRVIDGFMDQTGDPKDNGTGGSTQPNLAPEFSFRRGSDLPFVLAARIGGLEAGFVGPAPVTSQSMDLGMLTADNRVAAYVTYCPGVAGMARADAADSANSQFFLMRAANLLLNQKYSAFGRVIAGMDVVRSIKTGEPPAPPADTMTRVRVMADLPAAERPRVRVIDPRGPWMKAAIERARADKPADFSLCDIDLPSEIK
jgi:peptidylprolyl isomerase